MPLLAFKFTKFLMSFLERRVFLQTLRHSSMSWDMALLYFFIKIFKCFGQKKLIKVKISRFWTAGMKINQIPCVTFQATSQFSSNFCVTLQCHDTQFLWNFLAETLHDLDRKSPPMYNFSDFKYSNESSPNSSCQFWNHKARVFSNFALLFSLMKDISPVFF